MSRFTNKVVLVTGGTSGIGKVTALAFAKEGAKVVVSGRREKEGLAVVEEITKAGGVAHFVQADVAKEADVKRLVEATVAKFGRLDVAFNNAGVEWTGPLGEVTEIWPGFEPENTATCAVPKATRTPGNSPAPVIRIDAPPPLDPIDGVTERIVGAGFLTSGGDVGAGFPKAGRDGTVGPRSHPPTPQTVRKPAANSRSQ
jgi:NAD(P)-dependent dehydrogenase (short-subunit alcohol dehydrogenase family)